MTPIQQRLFDLQDAQYRSFQQKLIPGVDPESVIGVRTPALRALAREIAGSAQAEAFLAQLPHAYYDENNLHGMLLERIRDYDACVEALDRFLPFVDNWASCDLMSPKVLGRHPDRLEADIRRWMASDWLYTARFGIEMLMSWFLDARFKSEYLDWVAALRSQEYYLNMMIAWFFATALAKQYEAAIVCIEDRRPTPGRTTRPFRRPWRATA